ncbi:hypothetical protein PORY_000016 [Pneumocystis oryctolagi]|uniref:Uncharacterized protein n=1 Tax=Pneumocystis oryctolagi TaxID=42067 RepID=A0ACB7CEK9_9ASCO|nr:hypothetical protein PORY_000016 [Pneumocystis oryctolagi]
MMRNKKTVQQKKNLKQTTYKYVLDASGPAGDRIFDVATFEAFLHERIKIGGRTGCLGDTIFITCEGQGKISIVAHVPFSGRYLKYLTKKFLKKHQLRDWLRVVSTTKGTYELRFYNVVVDSNNEDAYIAYVHLLCPFLHPKLRRFFDCPLQTFRPCTQMVELLSPNDLVRVRKLVEILTEQLSKNQETIALLKHQVEILKDELLAIAQTGDCAWSESDKKQVHEHAQLLQENKALKDENHALNALLDAYEDGLNEILSKIRTFINETTRKTLQLHQHYRTQLLDQQEAQQLQQKSYLDLQEGLYKINTLIRQAYTTYMLDDSAIEALQTENYRLREMLCLNNENDSTIENNNTFLQPCYVLYPEDLTQEYQKDTEATRTRRISRAYCSESSKKHTTNPFPNLMHGRETDASKNYRYSCFCSEFNSLEEETYTLLESFHSKAMHALCEFVNREKCLPDESRISTAIMFLGAHFSNKFEFYTRITTLLEDCIHGPIINLHAHQITNMKICFKQIMDACIQFGEKMSLRDTKTQLGKDMFTAYCDYDPECVIQWYEKAVEYKLIDKERFKIIFFLQEIESFVGNFINHFIIILKKMHKYIPLLLLINVSTSIYIFQDILEKKALKALSIQYFNMKYPENALDIVVKKFLISSHQRKLHLGPHLYRTLLDIHRKYSYSVESFISAIKYVTLSHFYSNPISIVNNCDSAYSELISHHHLECLRSLPSMKQYVETLLETEDIYSVESILNDDHYFRNIINILIHNMEEHNRRLESSILLLDIVHERYVPLIQKKTISWIYGRILENNIQKDLDLILNPIRIMEITDLLHFFQEIFALENIHKYFPDFENFYEKISNMVEPLTHNDSPYDSFCKTNSYTSLKTSIEIMPKSDVNVIETEFHDIRKQLYQYLRNMLIKYFVSPMTLPLHELYYFNYSRTYLDVFHPRIRAAIDTALSLPGHYLSCNCENKGQELVNNLGDSLSKICVSCQPKICISYKLFLESGPLINISDWLSAFIQSASSENENDNNRQELEKYLETVFIQSIEELRYLGFIKPTKKRVDHVAKIMWMR